jgi:hypothetical protein
MDKVHCLTESKFTASMQTRSYVLLILHLSNVAIQHSPGEVLAPLFSPNRQSERSYHKSRQRIQKSLTVLDLPYRLSPNPEIPRQLTPPRPFIK